MEDPKKENELVTMKKETELVMNMERALDWCLDVCNELNGEYCIREFSLVKTKLDEAKMWFNKGLVEKL